MAYTSSFYALNGVSNIRHNEFFILLSWEFWYSCDTQGQHLMFSRINLLPIFVRNFSNLYFSWWARKDTMEMVSCVHVARSDFWMKSLKSSVHTSPSMYKNIPGLNPQIFSGRRSKITVNIIKLLPAPCPNKSFSKLHKTLFASTTLSISKTAMEERLCYSKPNFSRTIWPKRHQFVFSFDVFC